MGNSSAMNMMGGFMIAYLVIMFVVLAIGIALYVFSSLGLYSHAKRHNINNPWLAWLPVGNYWVSGKLADLATANKPGKKMNYTKWLMILSIVLFGACAFYLIIGLFFLFGALGGAFRGFDEFMGLFAGVLIFAVLIYLVLYAAAIAIVVIWSIGMYHVYLLYCTKGVAITFAILGGLFNLHGIFLFAIRSKPLLPPPVYTNVPQQGWPQYNPPQGYYPPQNPQA